MENYPNKVKPDYSLIQSSLLVGKNEDFLKKYADEEGLFLTDAGAALLKKELSIFAAKDGNTQELSEDEAVDFYNKLMSDNDKDFEKIKDYDHIQNVDKIIETFFTFSEEKGKVYEKINCNSNYNYIQKQTTNKLSIKSQDNFKSIQKFDEATQNIILTFINSAILGVYKKWIQDGKKIPVDKIIKITTTLVKTGLDKYLKES